MSILRSSKYLRRFLTEWRRPSVQSRMPDHFVSKPNSILQLSRYISSSPTATNRTRTVENAIERLDRDVRRVGRISGKELLSVFKDIKDTGRATPTQSLFVIRCCGNLVPEESPEARSKLVSEVWDTFENLGVQLDISHYNALLSVYIENQFEFSPTEFLKKLEAKGIEPNRVTYQRLVTACCHKGDVEAATDILQIMKEKGLPINEAIFNSLIIGHSTAKDMESAVGILSVMKQAGLEPSVDTYTALLSGYAINGDIDSILRTLDECSANEIELGSRDLLEVAYNLSVHGHSNLLEKLLARVNKGFTYNEDAKTVCIRLITIGDSAGALEIVKTMVDSNAEGLQRGNFLILHAFKCNWPLEKTLALCEEMKSAGYNVYSYMAAAEASLLSGNTETSFKLLSTIADDETIPQHCFWPLLVLYGKNGDFDGVVKTLKLALDASDQPIGGETLKDYVCPYLRNDQTIEDLRRAGIPLGTSASAMVGHLLTQNKIKEAAKFALRYQSNYNNVINRRLLFAAFSQAKDIPSLATLVQVFSDNDEDKTTLPGSVALNLLRNYEDVAENLFSAYLEAGVGLTPQHAETAKEILGEKITPRITELLSALTSPDLVRLTSRKPVAPKKSTLSEKDEGSLLNTIAEVEAKGGSSAGLKRQLLLHYCHNKDLEKAVAMKEQLEKEDLVMQPGLLFLFMDLYAHHNKLEEAMKYYAKAIEADGSRLDASKTVRLAALLCANDRFQDALDLINKHPQNAEEIAENTYGHLTLSWKLLNTCAEKKEVDWLKKTFDALVNNSYIEPNNIFLGPLVKVHLLNDDLDNALQQFEECCIKYRATPWKNELTCKLINNEDAAALQKVADLSTQIHGEVNSLFDLVISFVECNKVKQARKILETPGLRTKTQRISSACRRFYLQGETQKLTTLLEVTKGFNHINRAEIFNYLLLSYTKADDVDKAYGLWTQMQEEDIKPSDEFLSSLGQCLKKHDRPVPFVVPPTVNNESAMVGKPAKQAPPAIKQFRKALYARELDEALQLMSEISEADLTKSDLSRLSNLLINNGRIGEASKLLVTWLQNGYRPDVSCLSDVVNSVAKIGDVDSMKSIGALLDSDLRKLVSYSNRYAHCMTEAGRAAEVVEDLKKTIEKSHTPEEIEAATLKFPRGGIFSIFQIAPELLPEIEEMAELYRKKGVLDPLNQLWVHYTVTNDTDKAAKAWELLKNKERLMFMPIIKTARQNLDVDLIQRLIGQFKDAKVNSIAIGVLYTCMIDIQMSQDKLAECEKTLEEALTVCKLENLGIGVLSKLKTNMEMNGKTFKYEIPRRVRKREMPDDSSSSSDSDNEETAKSDRRERV